MLRNTDLDGFIIKKFVTMHGHVKVTKVVNTAFPSGITSTTFAVSHQEAMEQTFARPASSLRHNDLVSEQICAQDVRIGARNTTRSLHECKSTQIRTALPVQTKYFGSRILDCAREQLLCVPQHIEHQRQLCCSMARGILRPCQGRPQR